MKKNQIIAKENDCMVNPLSGEVFDPDTREYVYAGCSPFETINNITQRMTNFCAEHRNEFTDCDRQNMINAICGLFNNRVEYLLINILKEYETELTIKPIGNIIPRIIDDIRLEFSPIFNLPDYDLISEDGVRINDIISEYMINYMVTTIMNSYLKYSKVDNDSDYLPFINSNYAATALIAMRLHSMFETIFIEIHDQYRPSLAKLFCDEE